MDDFLRQDFIYSIDKSDVAVDDFELRFIRSNRGMCRFSERQRDVIDRMIIRYAGVIGWDPSKIPELPF